MENEIQKKCIFIGLYVGCRHLVVISYRNVTIRNIICLCGYFVGITKCMDPKMIKKNVESYRMVFM